MNSPRRLQVMKARGTIILFAIGLSASWVIAVGEGESSEDVSSAQVDHQENAASLDLVPAVGEALAPGSPIPPPKDATPESLAETKVPPLVEQSAIHRTTDLAEVPPASEGGVVPSILPPDGESAFPLSISEADLVAMTATPFNVPASELADPNAYISPESVEGAGELPAPAEDRTGSWITAPGGLSAQSASNGGGGFPLAPSGFTLGNSGIPAGGVPIAEGIFEGFSLVATFSGTYISNVTSSPGEPIAPIQDDFIFGLGGSISYLSKAADWTFGGSYTGKYNQYLEVTSYSGYNQGLGLVANYDGNRLSASVTANVSYDQGNNRYYSSEFVQQTTYNLNLNTRYRISSKTSLQGDIGQSFSTTSENSFNDTESFNLGLAALWKYSKLTELGPGIRYTYLSGGGRDARTSIGPELLVNYKLATKVSLNSRVGVQFAEYESGGSADPSLAASIGINYAASKLWSMNLAFFSGNQADASSADVFTQVNSVRLGYVRKIRRASLNLGVSYEINTYETPGNSSLSAYPDQNYFSVNSSLGMPVFSNTSFGSIFFQYSDQSGSASQTWDAVQSGISLSRSF